MNLVCASEDAILSVVEPEVCFYEFKVGSPAACHPRNLDPSFDADLGDDVDVIEL